MISHTAIESPYIAGLPSEVEVRAGAETVVELRSAAGAGYVWEVIPVDGSSAIAELRIEVEPAPRQIEPPSNQPAAVMLKITGREPGQARWRLRLVRRWGERETLVEHELEIKVSD
jgi:predicted secreted protein